MTLPASAAIYLGLLFLLVCERGAELVVSRRNARRAFAAGGVETGRRAYAVMVAVHALFPLACAGEVLLLKRAFPGAAGFAALTVALAAQALRWWAVAALGHRWNTRIIVVPGGSPVTGGPYRFLRHPNYLAVVLEMAAVPLTHGAWLTALVFSALNAALLAVRIPAEERALGRPYAEAFEGRRRLVPGGRVG
ncbi:MAG: isoprenylcysteine carboxyl methyltransferase family protein [Thermoanaerobaculia bacterium]